MYMNKPISLSIFFPTYNEELNIRESVEKTVRVARTSPYISEFEILVINDGSSDNTEKVTQELEAEYPEVRLVNHAKNMGYGAALKTGIAAAKLDYIFFTDADLQFDIIELQNLLVHLEQYPVVIGYRAPRQDPFMRLMNARVWNLLNRTLFGLKVRDIDCAFKIFKRELVQPLRLRSRGAMISAETLIRLKRKHVPIKEVPVSHLPRVAGSATGAKLSVIARAFGEMIRLYRGELGLVTQKEALKFMSVGVLNTALDAFAYIALTRTTDVFNQHLVAAKFFSFLAGTVSSLLLNRSWTFGVSGRIKAAEVARFYTVTSLSITLNVAIMNLLVSFGVYDLTALAITTVFTFVANFTLSKAWVFNQKKVGTTEEPAPIQQS
jgi:glycosyltransferase involved in cell wall biosynthesis